MTCTVGRAKCSHGKRKACLHVHRVLCDANQTIARYHSVTAKLNMKMKISLFCRGTNKADLAYGGLKEKKYSIEKRFFVTPCGILILFACFFYRFFITFELKRETLSVEQCVVLIGVRTFLEEEMVRIAQLLREMLSRRPSREDLQRRGIYKGPYSAVLIMFDSCQN